MKRLKRVFEKKPEIRIEAALGLGRLKYWVPSCIQIKRLILI